MIEYFLMGIILFGPILFIVGILIGGYHVKRLAHNGGEERYPEKVQNAVHEYRENNKDIIESLKRE